MDTFEYSAFYLPSDFSNPCCILALPYDAHAAWPNFTLFFSFLFSSFFLFVFFRDCFSRGSISVYPIPYYLPLCSVSSDFLPGRNALSAAKF